MNPSYFAWLYLVLFVRIGAFQWVTANPNKKFFSLALTRVLVVIGRALNAFPLSLFPFTPRLASARCTTGRYFPQS
jgi:hypothetical protein